MQFEHSVRFNAVMNTILTASNMLIGVITIPYITRTLSVEGYGNVTFAQNISQWLSALCLVGIPTYGVRECARARDDPRKLASVVRELLAIITVCTLTVLACFALAIAFVPRLHGLAALMCMFLVSTLLLSFGVEWFFQAMEEARKCAETGEEKTILFGLTGTGYFDLYAYESYNNGTMTDTIPTDEQLQKSFAALPNIG